MARLQKLKFENADSIMEYYMSNRDEIFSKTFNLIEKFYNKNGFIDNVKIYEFEVKILPEMGYISVLKEEWDKCLYEMLIYYVKTEQYEQAAKIRDFIQKIFGFVREDL